MRIRMAQALAFACMIMAVAAVQPVFAQGKTEPSASAGAVKFVQEFYNWYGALTRKPSGGGGSDTAIKVKSASFAPPLLKALQADSAASAKVHDEIVGLDFDPFLNTQAETAPVYVVTNPKLKGGNYLVDVYAVFGGKKEKKPTVVPEVQQTKSGWCFVNFHYGNASIPANDNLISILKELAANRLKYPK